MGKESNMLEGGCACGAVRYRMTDKPIFVHCCHCRQCQRQSGSAFALNAIIESDKVMVLQGDPEPAEVPSPSGKGQLIVRCPECRVAVWSHYGGAGDLLAFIRVGSLDEPDRVQPDVHIYTATKQPWVQLPDGVPAFEEYYNFREVWPEDSIQRRVALTA